MKSPVNELNEPEPTFNRQLERQLLFFYHGLIFLWESDTQRNTDDTEQAQVRQDNQ
jgi:hypothetical protein